MKPFKYLEPTNTSEVCQLLTQYKREAKIIAGGTDLLPSMKKRIIRPQYLISLSQIGNLDGIDYSDNNGIMIGTLATLRDIEKSPIIRRRAAILTNTATKMASQAIRNMATIGGNLCNASPSADMAPPLIGLGARIKLVGPMGDRTIALEEFFAGPGSTTLGVDEILVHIEVPNPPPNTAGTYLKVRRTTVDVAIVGVAIVFTADLKQRVITNVRIVLGGAAPVPIRAIHAEEMIRGKETSEAKWIDMAARAAVDEAKPITDMRASADYRRDMISVLVREGMRELITLFDQSRNNMWGVS